MIVLFGIRMGRNYTDKCMYEHAKKKPTVFNTGIRFPDAIGMKHHSHIWS